MVAAAEALAGEEILPDLAGAAGAIVAGLVAIAADPVAWVLGAVLLAVPLIGPKLARWAGSFVHHVASAAEDALARVGTLAIDALALPTHWIARGIGAAEAFATTTRSWVRWTLHHAIPDAVHATLTVARSMVADVAAGVSHLERWITHTFPAELERAGSRILHTVRGWVLDVAADVTHLQRWVEHDAVPAIDGRIDELGHTLERDLAGVWGAVRPLVGPLTVTIPAAIAGIASRVAALEAEATDCFRPACSDWQRFRPNLKQLEGLLAGLSLTGMFAAIVEHPETAAHMLEDAASAAAAPFEHIAASVLGLRG